jgi:DNA-binding winged helix-turn-helix (wHTH) protein/Tfp pilus assembly protein PilF
VTSSAESPVIVSFGIFEADFRSAELRRSGVKVKIQDLPFRALKVLLDHPNQIVTREDFRQALWADDVFVDFDRAISSAIKRLRDALGDSADNPIFVQTIERRGYRWIAPTSAVSAGLIQAGTESAAANGVVAQVVSDTAPSVGNTGSSSDHPTRHHYYFSNWKLAYLLPVAVLLFVVWSFRPSSRTANASLHPAHPANQQARDLYLEGRYYWNKRTPDDLHKAVDYFTQAIVHDPGYADAYVGLADCYNLLREYTGMPANEAYPRAKAAAARAVELDDTSSQAHASLAFASFWGFWDAATSDHEFRRAIELDPNNAVAHHWYAMTLDELGYFPQALTQIDRAQALDPTSRSILADKAIVLGGMGREKEAIDLLRQMENADPAFLSPHRYLRYIYLQTADYRNYVKELREEAVLTQSAAAMQIADASEKGFASGGAHGMFESQRRQQETLVEQGKLDPYPLAQTCALAGDPAGALKYLKVAYDQHSQELPSIGIDRAFLGMHDEPAFQEIKAAMKLPYADSSGQ